MGTIRGGIIPTGGVVKLNAAYDTGYVILPTGQVLTSDVNGIINTTYNGKSGRITYYVPKVGEAELTDSSIAGNIVISGVSTVFCYENLIKSIKSKDVNYLDCNSCVIETLILQEIYNLDASNNMLTAKSIGDILHQAFLDDRQNVYFNISGGTNANSTQINNYLVTTYGVTFNDVLDRLTVSGSVIYNS